MNTNNDDPSSGVHQLTTPRKIKSITAQIARQRNNRVIDAMSTLFSTGGAIGAFFAGFTLNIVVSVDAAKRPEVRLYSAICSFCFVLLVLLCSAGNVVFAFYKEEFLPIMTEIHTRREKKAGRRPRWDRWKPRYLWAVFGLLPSLLFCIMAAGVYFFFLIMRVYEPGVAYVGLVIVGLGTVCGGLGWLSLLYSYTPWAQKVRGRDTAPKSDGPKQSAPGPARAPASAVQTV